MLSKFHCKSRLSREVNVPLSVLSPKVSIPMERIDFRPISLVGSAYKILSKILANRLRSVLPLIISPYQGAFVQKRQIFYGIIIANELTDSRKKARMERVTFKIDMERCMTMLSGALLITCRVDSVLASDGKLGFRSLSLLHCFQCLSMVPPLASLKLLGVQGKEILCHLFGSLLWLKH